MSMRKELKPNLLEVISDEFAIARGSPAPLGASIQKSGINFAIFSKHATSVTLVLFISGEHEPVARWCYLFPASMNRLLRFPWSGI